MTDMVKDKRHPDARAKDEKMNQAESSEICEICGQKLERDPESGEYSCPDCDDSDTQEQ
jgi:transposase